MADPSNEVSTQAAEYIVLHDNLPVNATQSRDSAQVGSLAVGARVQVVEMADVPDQGRIRARITNPAGWISTKRADDRAVYAEKASAAGGAAASNDRRERAPDISSRKSQENVSMSQASAAGGAAASNDRRERAPEVSSRKSHENISMSSAERAPDATSSKSQENVSQENKNAWHGKVRETARKRSGEDCEILLHDDSDPLLAWKVSFKDGQQDWYKEADIQANSYVVIIDSLPVNASQARSSPEVARLSKGKRVHLIEVASEPYEGRVRARIADPAGWITSKMADDSRRFIEIEADHALPTVAHGRSEVRAAQATPVVQKGEAILVNHGSFNPVHRGHINMMLVAKERLEREGYTVIKAHLGITRASHILGKGSPVLESDCRIQCINLLAAELDAPWIVGDKKGEAVPSGGKMGEMLAKERPGVTCFNVKGADLAQKYGVRYGAPTIWVGREGSKLPDEGTGPTFCVATDAETGDFSSTKLRQALKDQDGDALERLCGARATEYLLQLPGTSWRQK